MPRTDVDLYKMTARKRASVGVFHSHWCVLLSYHITRKRLTGQSFATLVGVSQQMMHSYSTGKTRPPLHLVARWAKALGMGPSDLHQFLEAAYEAHTPEPIWARLIALESKAPHPFSDQTVESQRDICRASLNDCVEILRDVEALFYARSIPMERIREKREIVGVAIRSAIERYARPPTA